MGWEIIGFVVLSIIAMILIFIIMKNELLNGEKWYTYFFPLLAKKCKIFFFGPLLEVVWFLSCLVSILTNNQKWYNTVLSFFILSWASFFLFLIIIQFGDFIAGMKHELWFSILFLPVIFIFYWAIMQDRTSSLYYQISLIIAVFAAMIGIIATIYLMVKLLTDSATILDRTDKYKKEHIVVAHMYLILSQLMNVYMLTFSVGNFFDTSWIYSDGKPLHGWLDLAYYIIMTYTSVGYGDIIPKDNFAKIMACVISFLGFFTSASIIGQIAVGIGKKVNMNEK